MFTLITWQLLTWDLSEALAVFQSGDRDRQICLLAREPIWIGLGCHELAGKPESSGNNLALYVRHAPCFLDCHATQYS
jgi:hypothetical protein